MDNKNRLLGRAVVPWGLSVTLAARFAAVSAQNKGAQASAAAPPNYEPSRHTIDDGGVMFNAGHDFKISGTIGQHLCRVSRRIVIDAIRATFPPVSEAWADSAFTGLKTGSVCQPHTTPAESASVANPGETMHIKASSSNEKLAINREVARSSWGGRAVMGRWSR